MEESASSDQDGTGEEKVINIIVIQEPTASARWNKIGSSSCPGKETSSTNGSDEDVLGLTGREDIREEPQSILTTPHYNSIYRPQTFVIDPCRTVTSTSSILNIQPAVDNGCGSSSGLITDYSSQQGRTQTSVSSLLNLSDFHAGVEYCLDQEEQEGVSSQKKVRLVCGESTSCPTQSESPSLFSSSSSSYTHIQNHQCTSKITNTSSATTMTPQVSQTSSSLPFSPVVALSSSSSSSSLLSGAAAAITDPITPTTATTPDSGFYTPSQFEPSSSSTNPATINPFFTSTPRRSTSSTSTPCVIETPKRIKCEGLQQRFTDLYNAMECDSLDDSGGTSEDPKEGNDSGEGEGSPNSSLRSVQWLKGFSIGDSVKPLLSSPPTPCDKNKNKTTNSTNSVSTVTATSALATSSLSSSPCLKPLPVIMAPRIPTYLQSQSILASTSSSSSTSTSSSALVQGASASVSSIQQQSLDVGSCSNANDSSSCSKKAVQRKALEELKMNKPERNIGRSKYTGKIFSRPGYSYMDLIKMAMQSSEEGEMTLKQIVTWIEDHFPFFKHEAKDSWKSSIRHNLSLHSDFMKADDKKHGCKWKLCNDVVQPNLHVPAPQEMTSVQTAYLKRVKKNIPQPILPKVNAYALVPIHNLTAPVGDSSQQPQQQQQQQQVPPLMAMPRKPVHILPKQVSDTVVQSIMVPQDGHFTEDAMHQQVFQILSSQDTPSEHQVIQELLQKGPQHYSVVPSSFDDQTIFSTSNYINNVPVGIYQSSDSNSNQSVGFPSLSCFDQSLPSTSQLVDSSIDCDPVSNIVMDSVGGFCYPMGDDSAVISDIPAQASFQTNHQPNFPLNSVVEIRQEQGTNPGEQKIVFVLQDGENSKRMKKCDSVRERRGSCSSSNNSCRKSSKNLSEIFEQQEAPPAKASTAMKSFTFGGKKRLKEGQKGGRQHRGPVLNLQSVLQSSMEDKKASDTIGLLLQEEDESKRLMCKESVVGGGDGFTRVKSFSERESQHLNSHMQRALQEQTANCMSHISTNDGNTDLINSSLERMQYKSQGLPKAKSKLLPLPVTKKNSLKDRMCMVKNRNAASSDSFDDTTSSFSNQVLANDSYPRSSTRSASQLVFRRLSSGDQSSISLTSLHSHSSSSLPLSDNKSGECDMNQIAGRRVGNILRSKSRRKQVHIPLTNAISPVRRKSHPPSEDEQSSVVYINEENAQFVDMSGERGTQIEYPLTSATDQLPISLCMDVQQPSLKILQEKPFEHDHQTHTLLKEKPTRLSQGSVPEDMSFSDYQMNSSDVDQVIENIFVCSDSPIKVEASDSSDPIFSGSVFSNFHSVDRPCTSEFDTPPSMLHFLSTFPKDMDFPSQGSLGHENYKAPNCDSSNREKSSAHRSHSTTTRISSTPMSDHHHLSKTYPNRSVSVSSSRHNNFLETPSPPSRYSVVCNSSPAQMQRKTCYKEENRSFGLLSISPVAPCRDIGGNSSSSILAGNNSMSMYTPPCGTILRSSSSKLSPGMSSSTGESSSTRSFTNSNPSSDVMAPLHYGSGRHIDNDQPTTNTALPLLTIPKEELDNHNFGVEQSMRSTVHNHTTSSSLHSHLLPTASSSSSLLSSSLPLLTIPKEESDNHHFVVEQSMRSTVHNHTTSSSLHSHSLSAASASSSSLMSSSSISSSSLPMAADLTHHHHHHTTSSSSSYSLTTPPCGIGNGVIDNTTTPPAPATTSNGDGRNNNGTANNTAPLFLHVPGTSIHPIILSPTPSSANNGSNNHHQQQHHQHHHHDLFPSFTPESLSVLGPSIMENLDQFINNLPGLSPGFPNIQLSPNS